MAAIPGLGVVGDGVADLEVHVLEEERVPRAHLLHRGGAVEQRDLRLVAAVHGIADVQATDAVVVLRLDLGEHLVDHRHLHVPAGSDEAHDGRLILEGRDHVLRRGAVPPALVVHQLDPVVGALVHRVRGDEPVAFDVQVPGFVAFDQQPPRLDLEDRQDAEAHLGTPENRDVAAVLDGLVRQPAVAGEAVQEVDLVDVGQVLDPDPVDRRADAGGVDVVVRVGAQVQGDEVVSRGFAADHPLPILPGFRQFEALTDAVHRPLLPLAVRVAGGVQRPQPEFDAVRVEAQHRRADQLIGAACDRHVPRRHDQAVRIVDGRRPPGREQQHRAVLKESRAEQHGHHAGARHTSQRRRETLQRAALDPCGETALLAALDRLLQNLPLEFRRHPLGVRGRTLLHRTQFHRAQHRGLERRLVLLHVERHLARGHTSGKRNPEQPNRESDQRQVGEPAEHVDRALAVEEVVHAPDRDGERSEAGHDQRDQPAQRHLHPPAQANATDHAHQFAVGRVVDGIETGSHRVS